MKDSKHRRAFEEFAEKAQQELGDSLQRLVLYGSVARGEETEESDVDVFAVVETEEQKKWLERFGAEIGVEHGVLFSLIVRTSNENEGVEDSVFGSEVMNNGEIHV